MSTQVVLEAYVGALLAGSRQRAFAAVESAGSAGLDLERVYLDVFQPALREVGARWERGTLTVAQEHLATAITQTAMARLASDRLSRAPTGGPTLLAACLDDERHEVGLRMVCDLLELEGWTTFYLGPSTPGRDLLRMAAERRPAVVALSASLAPHLLPLKATIGHLRALEAPRPLVLVGGRALSSDPGLAARLGADLTAIDAGEAVRRLRERFA